MGLSQSKKRSVAIIACITVLFLLYGFAQQTKLTEQSARNCATSDNSSNEFVLVKGGGFIMGADAVYPEEGGPRKLFVSPFMLKKTEVTNAEFARFVSETGYITEAEQEISGKPAGSAQFVATETPWDLMSWWQLDSSASWKTPDGAMSTLNGKGNYPVVHVSLNDARAYAAWAGGRIPNEIEWEYAASLGLFDPADPESGIRTPDGKPLANIWNGMFPVLNTEEDGFAGLAPVGCYPENLIGAYDMIGNVWEWTETPFGNGAKRFTIKGGSFLCGSNFCRRYRTAAKQSMETNFSTAHLGFRIVRDL